MKWKLTTNLDGDVNALRQWLLYDMTEVLGITQNDLADEAGVSQARISNLFNRSETPTPSERTAILRYLLKRAAQRRDEILESN